MKYEDHSTTVARLSATYLVIDAKAPVVWLELDGELYRLRGETEKLDTFSREVAIRRYREAIMAVLRSSETMLTGRRDPRLRNYEVLAWVTCGDERVGALRCDGYDGYRGATLSPPTTFLGAGAQMLPFVTAALRGEPNPYAQEGLRRRRNARRVAALRGFFVTTFVWAVAQAGLWFARTQAAPDLDVPVWAPRVVAGAGVLVILAIFVRRGR